MHRVVVIAVPPVVTFDLFIPELIFRAVEIDGRPAYDIPVCTAEPGVLPSDGAFDVVVRDGLEAVAHADTVMVTGGAGRDDVPEAVLDALRTAAASGACVPSICTGAFVLAAAGLSESRRATTYWLKSDSFRRRYPNVTLEPDVLFVKEGCVLTSAGLAAFIDLCLHMIRSDHGAAVANQAGRLAVVAPVRPGDQAQFIRAPLPPETGASLAGSRAWAGQRLDQPAHPQRPRPIRFAERRTWVLVCSSVVVAPPGDGRSAGGLPPSSSLATVVGNVGGRERPGR